MTEPPAGGLVCTELQSGSDSDLQQLDCEPACCPVCQQFKLADKLVPGAKWESPSPKKVYKALINAKFGNKLLFFEETRKVASHSVVHNKLKAPVYFFKFRFYSL